MEIKKSHLLELGLFCGIASCVVLSFAFKAGYYYQEFDCLPQPFPGLGGETTKFEALTSKWVSKNIPFYEFRLQQACTPPVAAGFYNSLTIPSRNPIQSLLNQPQNILNSGAYMGTFFECVYRGKKAKPPGSDATELEDKAGGDPDRGGTFGNTEYKFCPRLEILGIGSGLDYLTIVLTFIVYMIVAVADSKGKKSNKILGFVFPIILAVLFIIAGLLILAFAIMAFFGAYTCGDGVPKSPAYDSGNDYGKRICDEANLDTYRQDMLIIAGAAAIIAGVVTLLTAFFSNK